MIITSYEIQLLFKNVHRFPWNFANISVPRTGPIHSYLCEILAPYADGELRSFMRGKPSWSELQSFERRAESLLVKRIVEYSEEFYQKNKSERRDIADAVLLFLVNYEPFFNDFSDKLKEKLRLGLIVMKN